MTSGLLTPAHIAILLVIMLLLFGAKRLPETGRSLGRAMREFKEALTESQDVSAAGRPRSLTAEAQPKDDEDRSRLSERTADR